MTAADSRERTTTPSPSPSVPPGDKLDAASAVLNDVLECVAALQDDLHIIATRHVDSAPASSIHVLNLNASLARAVLEWIGRWPT
ncbi:hypothetical protein [Mycobacterium sp. 236(2023)]|uniref:hypothetical protein n=1 Tax=Mycobacterium sp. 236(2023) TaxID=3038163 RepID=UPI0024154CDB|nr:hypothetical protein [Mycobacterium sp. 236(2023)]MDG4668660.1 hypothetical protein [Mycobacterium sp. 236(2023)]